MTHGKNVKSLSRRVRAIFDPNDKSGLFDLARQDLLFVEMICADMREFTKSALRQNKNKGKE